MTVNADFYQIIKKYVPVYCGHPSQLNDFFRGLKIIEPMTKHCPQDELVNLVKLRLKGDAWLSTFGFEFLNLEDLKMELAALFG